MHDWQERDRAEQRQKELEGEVDSLKERLDASQRAWAAMRRGGLTQGASGRQSAGLGLSLIHI